MYLADPADHGFAADRLNRIGPVMRRFVDNGELPGTLTFIARHGQPVHLDTYGFADLEAQKPLTPDTIFRIYSMTKPITSVAVMMLHEQGHFLLQDPIAKFIPAFDDTKVLVGRGFQGPEFAPPRTPITIRHLLSHTAGLSYGFHEDTLIEEQYRQAKFHEADLSNEERANKIAGLPLVFHPGEGWRYSVATDVLGRLVEVVSGQSLGDYLQAHIFEPLGMVDTGFWAAPAAVDRLAANYKVGENGRLCVSDAPAQSTFARPRANMSGGGGLVSTLRDYFRFTQCLLNGGRLDGVRLLSPRTVRLMVANHLPDHLLPFGVGPNLLWGHGFGLGFRVVLDPGQAGFLSSAGEYGWSGAAKTYFWIDPKEDMLAIFMTQIMQSDHPVQQYFRALTYQALVD